MYEEQQANDPDFIFWLHLDGFEVLNVDEVSKQREDKFETRLLRSTYYIWGAGGGKVKPRK